MGNRDLRDYRRMPLHLLVRQRCTSTKTVIRRTSGALYTKAVSSCLCCRPSSSPLSFWPLNAASPSAPPKGKGNIAKFVAGVKAALERNDIAGARALCAKQKGSVAAVVDSALVRYEEMDKNTVL